MLMEEEVFLSYLVSLEGDSGEPPTMARSTVFLFRYVNKGNQSWCDVDEPSVMDGGCEALI